MAIKLTVNGGSTTIDVPRDTPQLYLDSKAARKKSSITRPNPAKESEPYPSRDMASVGRIQLKNQLRCVLAYESIQVDNDYLFRRRNGTPARAESTKVVALPSD
jgi:hypothetical protein